MTEMRKKKRGKRRKLSRKSSTGRIRIRIRKEMNNVRYRSWLRNQSLCLVSLWNGDTFVLILGVRQGYSVSTFLSETKTITCVISSRTTDFFIFKYLRT